MNFFRAFSLSGAPSDLGAECPTCHVMVRYGIQPGQKITCCGVTSVAPDTYNWHALPCRSLRRGMPEISKRGFILLDTDAAYDGGSWDSESEAASFNPSKFEVPWT